jgi:RNA recognition motif-containing protein
VAFGVQATLLLYGRAPTVCITAAAAAAAAAPGAAATAAANLLRLCLYLSTPQVRLHTDKDTRKSKGYAHVHFADEAGLEQ